MTFKQRQIIIFLQLKAKDIGIFLLYTIGGVGCFIGLVEAFIWSIKYIPYICHIVVMIAEGFIFALFGIMIVLAIHHWFETNWHEAYYRAREQEVKQNKAHEKTNS